MKLRGERSVRSSQPRGRWAPQGSGGGLKLAGEERRGAVRGKGAGIAWETPAPQGPGSQVG